MKKLHTLLLVVVLAACTAHQHEITSALPAVDKPEQIQAVGSQVVSPASPVAAEPHEVRIDKKAADQNGALKSQVFIGIVRKG